MPGAANCSSHSNFVVLFFPPQRVVLWLSARPFYRAFRSPTEANRFFRENNNAKSGIPPESVTIVKAAFLFHPPENLAFPGVIGLPDDALCSSSISDAGAVISDLPAGVCNVLLRPLRVSLDDRHGPAEHSSPPPRRLP